MPAPLEGAPLGAPTMPLSGPGAPPNLGTQPTPFLDSQYAAFVPLHAPPILTFSGSVQQLLDSMRDPQSVQEREYHWTSEDRPLEVEKSECPILYTPIGAGDTYCSCSVCKNCFGAEALKEALKTGGDHCPMCRGGWTNWVVYTNTAAGEAAAAPVVPAVVVRPSWWRRLFSCFSRRQR